MYPMRLDETNVRCRLGVCTIILSRDTDKHVKMTLLLWLCKMELVENCTGVDGNGLIDDVIPTVIKVAWMDLSHFEDRVEIGSTVPEI